MNYLEFFFYIIFNSLTYGLAWFMLDEIYNIKIIKIKRYYTPLTFNLLVNIGMLIGFTLSILRWYLQKPFIDYVIDKLFLK